MFSAQQSITAWWSWGLPWQSHWRSRVIHRLGRCRKQISSYLVLKKILINTECFSANTLPTEFNTSTYFDAVLTFTSKSPLKTNWPGFQSKFSLLHSQCKFSVVLYGSCKNPESRFRLINACFLHALPQKPKKFRPYTSNVQSLAHGPIVA